MCGSATWRDPVQGFGPLHVPAGDCLLTRPRDGDAGRSGGSDAGGRAFHRGTLTRGAAAWDGCTARRRMGSGAPCPPGNAVR